MAAAIAGKLSARVASVVLNEMESARAAQVTHGKAVAPATSGRSAESAS